jgi:hypothetical protein
MSQRFAEVGPTRSLLSKLVRVFLLMVPGILLFVAAVRCDGGTNVNLWLGTAFQFVVCLLTCMHRQNARQPMGPAVVTLYVVAFGWLWIAAGQNDDWYLSLARAVLLVVPLLSLASQVLTVSGATTMRRARLLAERLAARKEWPADLEACRTLPEVKALREALQADPTPALLLLGDRRPQVQVAALAALEFRKTWLPGQAELVLQAAQRGSEPLVRATAVAALGNVDDRLVVEALAEFLRDPAREVRQEATDALLWDSATRWSWVRHAIRRALADPSCSDDGALHYEGPPLNAEAVADLTAWSAQKGLIGQRASLTLGAHYARVLTETPSEEVVADMRRQLASLQTPGLLRIELARLLRGCEALQNELLVELLPAANPAPLRLMAAEALLAEGIRPEEAVNVLRDLGRMPNRELALSTAAVVQRRLGIDLGLAIGDPLPPVFSRQAADVARRLMHWAVQPEPRRLSQMESGLRERQPTGETRELT